MCGAAAVKCYARCAADLAEVVKGCLGTEVTYTQFSDKIIVMMSC